MRAFVDILDSLIHAIQLVARSVAFLLGIHLFLGLYFVRILSSEPVRPASRQRRSARRLQGVTARGQVFVTHVRPFSPARLLHLPALEPRPYEESLERSSAGIYKHLISHFLVLVCKIKYAMIDLTDRMESRGGKSGEMITMFRNRNDKELQPDLLQKLPSEIINHILLIASDTIPTKICLLSKTYHRLIIPRLYKTVQLSDPQIFHQFRMTMALHNPNIGQYVQTLSVGSRNFDSYGYFPDAIAESAALGVGLEQILITASNLKHLYLDLFSLAALHDGTASRLQNGSLPISLSTEYAAPQYLSLPVFSKLQHVELSVFGLDKMAVEYLRQALPHIKSLALRWVTRQSPGFDDMETSEESATEELDVWSQSNYQRNDFVSFIEALDSLRAGVEQSDASLSDYRQPLEAITVLAWPSIMRQLSQYYGKDEEVQIVDSNELARSYNDPAWNQSIGHQDDYSTRPRFDRPARRRAMTLNAVNLPPPDHEVTATPLRLAVDPTYKLGPRRGPLESWISQYG